MEETIKKDEEKKYFVVCHRISGFVHAKGDHVFYYRTYDDNPQGEIDVDGSRIYNVGNQLEVRTITEEQYMKIVPQVHMITKEGEIKESPQYKTSVEYIRKQAQDQLMTELMEGGLI